MNARCVNGVRTVHDVDDARSLARVRRADARARVIVVVVESSSRDDRARDAGARR